MAYVEISVPPQEFIRAFLKPGSPPDIGMTAGMPKAGSLPTDNIDKPPYRKLSQEAVLGDRSWYVPLTSNGIRPRVSLHAPAA